MGSFPETYNDLVSFQVDEGLILKEPHIATQLTEFCILLAEFTNLCFGGRLNLSTWLIELKKSNISFSPPIQ